MDVRGVCVRAGCGWGGRGERHCSSIGGGGGGNNTCRHVRCNEDLKHKGGACVCVIKTNMIISYDTATAIARVWMVSVVVGNLWVE